MKIFLKESFKSNTPILPDVEILDIWGVWDGPLFGICQVHSQKFFFLDLVESVWRYYGDKDYERLWRIYGVYDMPIPDCKKIIDGSRSGWQEILIDESECIGIFWDYQ